MRFTEKCGGFRVLTPGIATFAAYAALGRWRFGL
jgi:hypothetical protein